MLDTELMIQIEILRKHGQTEIICKKDAKKIYLHLQARITRNGRVCDVSVVSGPLDTVRLAAVR